MLVRLPRGLPELPPRRQRGKRRSRALPEQERVQCVARQGSACMSPRVVARRLVRKEGIEIWRW